MYQIDSEDANFLFLEKTDSPSHISLIAIYDQSERKEKAIRFQHIMQLINNWLPMAPKFKQKIYKVPGNLDFPYWINDEQFDLDYHIRHLALPKPGDWRQFCIQVSRLHSRQLDMSRPLWELYVIEGLDNVKNLPEGSFALYFKIHHCAMDEFSALELFSSLHKTIANEDQHLDLTQSIMLKTVKKPKLSQTLLNAVLNNTVKSVQFLRQSIYDYKNITETVAHLGIGAMRRFLLGESLNDAPATRFGKKLSASRVFAGEFYPRERFDNLVAKVPNATLSHVMLLICGEALRQYLAQHKEPPSSALIALLHVNVRNAGAHAMAGNHTAVDQVDVYTTTCNMLDRLQAVVSNNEDLNSIEELEQTGVKLRSVYENIPAPLLSLMAQSTEQQRHVSNQIMQSGNFGFSEQSGSKIPLYLMGAKLVEFTSISPLYNGCGLIFTASVYCEKVGLTFTSDRTMMSEPEVMQQCIEGAIARFEKDCVEYEFDAVALLD